MFLHYSSMFIDTLRSIKICRLRNVLSACHVIFPYRVFYDSHIRMLALYIKSSYLL